MEQDKTQEEIKDEKDMPKDEKDTPLEAEQGSVADAGKEPENQDLAECAKKRDEYLAGWQRARADFLNYKKEEADKISGLAFFAQAEVILNILEILDTFDRAEQETGKIIGSHSDSDLTQIRDGFLQVKKQIQNVLKKYDVEAIETIGEKFDPGLAEAVEQVGADADAGVVVEEIQKGYKVAGRVLRPAKVKVAK